MSNSGKAADLFPHTEILKRSSVCPGPELT